MEINDTKKWKILFSRLAIVNVTVALVLWHRNNVLQMFYYRCHWCSMFIVQVAISLPLYPENIFLCTLNRPWSKTTLFCLCVCAFPVMRYDDCFQLIRMVRFQRKHQIITRCFVSVAVFHDRQRTSIALQFACFEVCQMFSKILSKFQESQIMNRSESTLWNSDSIQFYFLIVLTISKRQKKKYEN